MFSLWASSLGDLAGGALDTLQGEWEEQDHTDWEGWEAEGEHREVEQVTTEEEEGEVGEEVRGQIMYRDGTVFQGRFRRDLSSCTGKLFRNKRCDKIHFKFEKMYYAIHKTLLVEKK